MVAFTEECQKNFFQPNPSEAMRNRNRQRVYLATIATVLMVYGSGSVTAVESNLANESTTAAARGYELLANKAFGSGTITQADFEKLWQVWPEDLRSQYENATPEEQRKLAYRRYGLVAAPGRDDGRPLAIALDDQGRWTSNCFQCHGGKVAGKVIPGLGNSHLAFQTLVNDLIKATLLGIVKRPPHSGAQNGGGRPNMPMFSLGSSNGTTNAQVFSMQLSAIRNNDLELIDPARNIKSVNHDLDAPPFWIVKKKSRIYIDGFAPKTHRVIMQFVLSPGNSAETIKDWENDFRDVLAWIESVEAPKYPYAINDLLADQGKLLFQENCGQCHGTYGENEEYPELMVDIDEIGTDSVRLTGMTAPHRRFLRDSWFGEYGKQEFIEEPKGYIAPPLDGIWASAPYLHNGSVPTLWHLMHSDQRPVVWLRDEDGYDQKLVGLQVEGLSDLPELPRNRDDQRRRYFDTRIESKSAVGHTFPDELTESEKNAVLEYLKTL